MGKVSPKTISPTILVLVVAGIVAVIFLATSFYIIDQAEAGVVTRLGKYYETTGPGLHYKLPFGIDQCYVVNTKTVQTEQFGFRTLSSGVNSTYSAQASESTMLTGDLNIIEVEWIIQYRIIDPKAWTFNVMERTATIRDVSRSAINMLVGDRAIMDIMGPGRSTIEAEGTVIMNDTFRGYGLGIDVIALKLQNIDPPRGVQEAFDDVNKAEQDMNRFINEGQQAYNAEIPRARGIAAQRLQEAQGYATERVNRSNGDIARFNSVYEEYRKAPDVTRQRLYYEMIEEVFKNDDGTVVIDRNFNNFLPLRDLGNARSRPAAAGGR
ncbi:FtsH protease activity modulator HflK [Breznakiellaceae bacterium SP9]